MPPPSPTPGSEQRVFSRVVDSVPIILAHVSIVKSNNRSLQFRLVAVLIALVLVLATDILNILDAEDLIKTLPVALQIDGEVAGQNVGNLMG